MVDPYISCCITIIYLSSSGSEPEHAIRVSAQQIPFDLLLGTMWVTLAKTHTHDKQSNKTTQTHQADGKCQH